MIAFLRSYAHLIVMILFWVFATLYLGPLIYLVLPVSIFLFRRRDLWPEMIMGFLMILVFSDMSPDFLAFRKIKSAKYAMMVALALVFLLETAKFQPLSKLFNLFVPFFIYCLFPLVVSHDVGSGVSKTISYALLYLIVPNYVLLNFRMQGWQFMRNLILFIVTLLMVGYGLQYVNPDWVQISGRFRGLFGNPNGLGIFSYLAFVLAYLVSYLKKDLFTRTELIIIFGVLTLMLIKSGSRTSLVAVMMMVLFARFFSLSPFLGILVLFAFVGAVELVTANLVSIVTSLGLGKYMRVETLDNGSGRYLAWNYAWEKINKDGYLIFGGGFGNDEYVMKVGRRYLESLGHQGGVHNSYLTMWLNTGIVGIMLYFRGFFLLFIKANKKVPIAFAIMFSVLFSVLYESWLTGSLNPYSILLVIVMALLTEDEVLNAHEGTEMVEGENGDDAASFEPAHPVTLP